MNTESNKHLGPIGDEEERRRRSVSTPRLSEADRGLDIRVPAPDAPDDTNLRPQDNRRQ